MKWYFGECKDNGVDEGGGGGWNDGKDGGEGGGAESGGAGDGEGRNGRIGCERTALTGLDVHVNE